MGPIEAAIWAIERRVIHFERKVLKNKQAIRWLFQRLRDSNLEPTLSDSWLFTVDGCGIPLDGYTVEVLDSGGLSLTSGTTDTAGQVTLTAVGGASYRINHSAYQIIDGDGYPLYADASGSLSGSTVNVTLNPGDDHICWDDATLDVHAGSVTLLLVADEDYGGQQPDGTVPLAMPLTWTRSQGGTVYDGVNPPGPGTFDYTLKLVDTINGPELALTARIDQSGANWYPVPSGGTNGADATDQVHATSVTTGPLNATYDFSGTNTGSAVYTNQGALEQVAIHP